MAPSDLDHVIGTRMNAEPAILRGCSSTELLLVATGATLLWVPVAAFAALIIGPMSIGLAGLLIVGSVYVGAGLFLKIKRGRPDGYYQQWVGIRLQKAGISRPGFIILKEGMLRIGRTWHR